MQLECISNRIFLGNITSIAILFMTGGDFQRLHVISHKSYLLASNYVKSTCSLIDYATNFESKRF